LKNKYVQRYRLCCENNNPGGFLFVIFVKKSTIY